jgi:hypothetical protein
MADWDEAAREFVDWLRSPETTGRLRELDAEARRINEAIGFPMLTTYLDNEDPKEAAQRDRFFREFQAKAAIHAFREGE